MSNENVETVVKQFEGTTARDFAGVMDTWAEDVILILHGEMGPFTGDTAAGKAAVGEWFVQIQVDPQTLAVMQDEVPRPVAGPGEHAVDAVSGERVTSVRLGAYDWALVLER